MKNFASVLMLALLVFGCATGSKPQERKATEPPPAAAAPVADAARPDSISGTVMSDDEIEPVPSGIEVKLRFGADEIGRQKIDSQNGFRFEGPFQQGRYELVVRAGVLNGTRAFSYSGGELKNITVVIAKKEPRRSKRRRHRR